MAETTRPLPEPDDVTRPFWDACGRRELRFQQCDGCGYQWLPPSVACPRCWGAETRWVCAGGEGTVVSFAVYRRAYHPAFKPLLPYVVAVIELAEGPRLVSNVVGVPPEDIHVDMRVRLEFQETGGLPLPVFRPSGRGA